MPVAPTTIARGMVEVAESERGWCSRLGCFEKGEGGDEVCLWQERLCTAVTCRCIIIGSRKVRPAPRGVKRWRVRPSGEYNYVGLLLEWANREHRDLSLPPVASTLLVADQRVAQPGYQTAETQASLSQASCISRRAMNSRVTIHCHLALSLWNASQTRSAMLTWKETLMVRDPSSRFVTTVELQ